MLLGKFPNFTALLLPVQSIAKIKKIIRYFEVSRISFKKYFFNLTTGDPKLRSQNIRAI